MPVSQDSPVNKKISFVHLAQYQPSYQHTCFFSHKCLSENFSMWKVMLCSLDQDRNSPLQKKMYYVPIYSLQQGYSALFTTRRDSRRGNETIERIETTTTTYILYSLCVYKHKVLHDHKRKTYWQYSRHGSGSGLWNGIYYQQ